MKVKSLPNSYMKTQGFADLTKGFVMTANIKITKLCLLKAEDIFKYGTAEIKNGVSNIYAYSVSRFMDIMHCNIKKFLPESLKEKYCKEIGTSRL